MELTYIFYNVREEEKLRDNSCADAKKAHLAPRELSILFTAHDNLVLLCFREDRIIIHTLFCIVKASLSYIPFIV